MYVKSIDKMPCFGAALGKHFAKNVILDHIFYDSISYTKLSINYDHPKGNRDVTALKGPLLASRQQGIYMSYEVIHIQITMAMLSTTQPIDQVIKTK